MKPWELADISVPLPSGVSLPPPAQQVRRMSEESERAEPHESSTNAERRIDKGKITQAPRTRVAKRQKMSHPGWAVGTRANSEELLGEV